MFDRIMFNLVGTVFNVTSRLIVWLMLLLSLDRYCIALPNQRYSDVLAYYPIYGRNQ